MNYFAETTTRTASELKSKFHEMFLPLSAPYVKQGTPGPEVNDTLRKVHTCLYYSKLFSAHVGPHIVI